MVVFAGGNHASCGRSAGIKVRCLRRVGVADQRLALCAPQFHRNGYVIAAVVVNPVINPDFVVAVDAVIRRVHEAVVAAFIVRYVEMMGDADIVHALRVRRRPDGRLGAGMGAAGAGGRIRGRSEGAPVEYPAGQYYGQHSQQDDEARRRHRDGRAGWRRVRRTACCKAALPRRQSFLYDCRQPKPTYNARRIPRQRGPG